MRKYAAPYQITFALTILAIGAADAAPAERAPTPNQIEAACGAAPVFNQEETEADKLATAAAAIKYRRCVEAVAKARDAEPQEGR